jgi:hypothetical protein
MTTTVDFVTGEVDNVLAVSTAALQLQQTQEMRVALSRDAAPQADAPGDNGEVQPASFSGNETGDTAPDKQDARPPASGSEPRTGATSANSNSALLWYMDENGQPHPVRVKTGLTTGALTEIESQGPDGESILQAGFQVIEQVISDAASTEASDGNGRGGPRGPF